MIWHRYEIKPDWQTPRGREPEMESAPGDYDFHAFSLELMDVLWAWAFAGCVLLVLLVLL